MIFSKKYTICDVYNLNPQDPSRYEKFCDIIASYDDRFYIDIFDSCIFCEEQLIHNRLIDAPNSSIKEQIFSYTKNSMWTSPSFDNFERLMKRIGVNHYTLEDYANISAICVERSLQERPFLCTGRDVFASYIGYIDIQDKDYLAHLDILREYKQNYKAEYEKQASKLKADLNDNMEEEEQER